MGNVAERSNQNVTEIASAPQRMLEMAIEKGASLEQLQQLMDLRDRHEANEARKAFVHAMAALKADPPRVNKSKDVEFSGTKYSHATLSDVCDSAVAKMSQFGLSHRWAVEQKDGGITVHCVITHEAGHSERTTMTAPPDDSGKKNRIQQIASTTTYLQRYTLMAALGMAARDMDNDARDAGEVQEAITDEQASTLQALAKEAKADMPQFLQYLSRVCKVEVKSISEIPAKAYTDAVQALDQKRRAAK